MLIGVGQHQGRGMRVALGAVALVLGAGCYRSHEAPGTSADAAPGAADGRPDASADVGFDAAAPDATRPDAGGVAPGVPNVTFPWNGYTTGSARVASDSPVIDHPLRPLLRWMPVAGADSYEVEMTTECSASEFRSCEFALPELRASVRDVTFRPATTLAVSLDPPVGRRYFWRVRACTAAACSGWDEVRYLDVGRDPDDFDGDGYADLSVGAWSGAAVFSGGAAGLAESPSRTFSNPTGRIARDLWSVTGAGDLNADGYADLVLGGVGRPAPDSDENSVFVFHGGPGGFSAEPSTVISHPWILFGASVSGAGDVDADGYADLIVVAFDPNLGRRQAMLFEGGPGGVSDLPTAVLDMVEEHAAGVGDVNGDGYADVLVGARVFTGGVGGIGDAPSVTLHIPERHAVTGLATTVTRAEDLDRDGFADLVTGLYYRAQPPQHYGSVFIHRGGPEGPARRPARTLDNPRDVTFPNGTFAAALAVGDTDGDGYGDLVVGAFQQHEPGDAWGRAYQYPGALRTDGVSAFVRTNPGPPRGSSERFGFAIATGDVDGDGFADLAIAAPTFDSGRVFIYEGGPGSLIGRPSTVITAPPELTQFGSTVAM